MLPRLDGVELCRILREESEVPIIMLKARETPAERVAGLDTGADDYIVKPFDPQEVIARAQAVLRRVRGRVQQVLTRGHITLNETTGSVMVHDEPVTHEPGADCPPFNLHATPQPSAHPRFNWSPSHSATSTNGFDRAMDSHIARLRKQVGRHGAQPIRTVYGAGYKFVVEDE